MNEQLSDALGRRDFLKKSAFAVLATSLTAFAGCESERTFPAEEAAATSAPTETNGLPVSSNQVNTGSGATQPRTYSDISGGIAANHGHTVTITADQLEDGRAVRLTLTTGAGHTHTVALSDRQVEALADGGDETMESSVDAGHSHAVRFRA
ncbi:MAG: hypothetical protein HYV35_06100 [Lentisphaerae bacterium]|nr:hypothetical protein [Lentisphaerota bacterium]